MSGAPKVITATSLYKVFGRRPEVAVERLRSGATRDELKADGRTAAVIDASFEVAEGEIFVVMGLSGSGKSTLIRMVNGLLPATAGQLLIGDRDIAAMSAKELRSVRQDRISMVFQHFALLPHRTVGENAAYGLEVKGLNRSEREAAAAEALELVGLDGWGDSLPGQLSGGMRQRVGLARALATGTDIMLMDEAFSALDPLIRREMQDQLVELQDRLGRTIVFITHDLNEAMRLGDRIAMMRDGRIVQIGTAEEICEQPANDYVAQFVQDVDRTRVLTAASVMDRPELLLTDDQDPETARRLMADHRVSSLLVIDDSAKVQGYVTDRDVARAIELGATGLEDILESDAVEVDPETHLADLFGDSASSPAPLAVADEHHRLLGIIPQERLLEALDDSGETSRPAGAGARSGAGSAPDESVVR